VKTLVFVSGDVHHSYSMTANLPGSGRPGRSCCKSPALVFKPRSERTGRRVLPSGRAETHFAWASTGWFPASCAKDGTGDPDLVLYQNAAALVQVSLGSEVDVRVNYLSGPEDARL